MTRRSPEEQEAPVHFSGLASRHYDFYNNSRDAQKEVNFFLRYALETGHMLDVSAGTGRIAFPLAAHEIAVTCVEPSPRMTDALYIKAANDVRVQPWLTPICAEPATFKLDRKFDLAMFYCAYMYLKDRADRLGILRNLREHLNPGGLLIIDTPIGDRPEGEAEISRHRMGRHEYRTTITNRREKLLNHFTFKVETIEDGKVLEQGTLDSTCTDTVSVAELVGTVVEAGFEVVERWRQDDDVNFIPFAEGDPDPKYALLVARRKG